MRRSLTATDASFLSLQSAVFCVQCELLSENNTPRCLACGSSAMLSLSRLLGGSLQGQQTAHLIEDAELDRLVRSLLYNVPRTPAEAEAEFAEAAAFSTRHRLRSRHHGPLSAPHTLIDASEIDLEPGISIIAEKAQTLTGATGAAIALPPRQRNCLPGAHRPHGSGYWGPPANRQRTLGRMRPHRRSAALPRCRVESASGLGELPAVGRAFHPGRSAAPLPAYAGCFRGAVVHAPCV